MTKNMKLKMKNRLHRYDINKPGHSHGHICTKYKMCLNIMTALCIEQHLSNIWSSIYKNVKRHCGWVKEKALFLKKIVYSDNYSITSGSLWNYYRDKVNDHANKNNDVGNYKINTNKTIANKSFEKNIYIRNTPANNNTLDTSCRSIKVFK